MIGSNWQQPHTPKLTKRKLYRDKTCYYPVHRPSYVDALPSVQDLKSSETKSFSVAKEQASLLFDDQGYIRPIQENVLLKKLDARLSRSFFKVTEKFLFSMGIDPYLRGGLSSSHEVVFSALDFANKRYTKEGISSPSSLLQLALSGYKICYFVHAVTNNEVFKYQANRRNPERFFFYRNSQEVEQRRFLFLDLDYNIPEHELMESLKNSPFYDSLLAVVKTSQCEGGGRYHLYFKVRQLDPKLVIRDRLKSHERMLSKKSWEFRRQEENYQEWFKRLNNLFAGDPACNNGLRLAQVPGFPNPKTGFLTQVIYQKDIYSTSELENLNLPAEVDLDAYLTQGFKEIRDLRYSQIFGEKISRGMAATQLISPVAHASPRLPTQLGIGKLPFPLNSNEYLARFRSLKINQAESDLTNKRHTRIKELTKFAHLFVKDKSELLNPEFLNQYFNKVVWDHLSGKHSKDLSKANAQAVCFNEMTALLRGTSNNPSIKAGNQRIFRASENEKIRTKNLELLETFEGSEEEFGTSLILDPILHARKYGIHNGEQLYLVLKATLQEHPEYIQTAFDPLFRLMSQVGRVEFKAKRNYYVCPKTKTRYELTDPNRPANAILSTEDTLIKNKIFVGEYDPTTAIIEFNKCCATAVERHFGYGYLKYLNYLEEFGILFRSEEYEFTSDEQATLGFTRTWKISLDAKSPSNRDYQRAADNLVKMYQIKRTKRSKPSGPLARLISDYSQEEITEEINNPEILLDSEDYSRFEKYYQEAPESNLSSTIKKILDNYKFSQSLPKAKCEYNFNREITTQPRQNAEEGFKGIVIDHTSRVIQFTIPKILTKISQQKIQRRLN